MAYGFASCLFIGTDWGFVVPGSFAYRVATACLDPLTYYDSALTATVGGTLATFTSAIVLAAAAGVVFSRGRKVEP